MIQKAAAMEIRTWVLGLCLLLELFAFSCRAFYHDCDLPQTSLVNYTRLAEIESVCNPWLPYASELKPDDSRSYRLKKELAFSNGDWEQEGGGAPLMPFDDSDIPRGSSAHPSPLRFVSFWVKHVNSVHQSNNTVGLTGSLLIGIGRNGSVIIDGESPFDMMPGMSSLKISFEGVYMETEENGGERLLCLLGNTTLPYGNQNDDLLEFTSNSGSYYEHRPKSLQDEHILLVLRYPQIFNLTNRAIQGEMRSSSARESFKYFDNVHIHSQLGPYSKYQFSTEKLKSVSFEPHILRDELEEDGASMFNGTEFCKVLLHFSSEAYDLARDWRVSFRYEYFNRLGPFHLGDEVGYSGQKHNSFKLIMQNLMCEPETADSKTGIAKVSGVLRAFPETMGKERASTRTGLSSMTLSVEGTWNSSTGKLCMIGCSGNVALGLEGCNAQIFLYFPRSFSNTQRSVIFGSISRIRKESDPFFPIMFQSVMRPVILDSGYGWYSRSYLSYNYSKYGKAVAFKERSQPTKLLIVVRKLLLTYPSLEDNKDLFYRHLSSDLSFDAYALPFPLHYDQKPEIFVRVEVLSLGPLFGSYAPWEYTDASSRSTSVEVIKSEVLNVSLNLMFTEARLDFEEKMYRQISTLFLEGIYDPLLGEMYLVGCRKAVFESDDNERGLDCLIEVKIRYPSETARWIVNPTVEITITSQRDQEDTLHFIPIKLKTLMIRCDKHERDVLFRKCFEEMLRIVVLVGCVVIILSQYSYMKRNAESVPFISLVMLAIQIFDYSLPLISSYEVLFHSKESESYSAGLYVFHTHKLLFKSLDYLGKFLSLVAVLLTARMWQMVSVARKELLENSNPRLRVPSDKRVLLLTSIVHVCFFLLFNGTSLRHLMDAYITGDDVLLWAWMTMLGDCLIHQVLVYFLLPQFIGKRLWKTPLKALRKTFVLGCVLPRVLLFAVYDNIRDPVTSPYSDKF